MSRGVGEAGVGSPPWLSFSGRWPWVTQPVRVDRLRERVLGAGSTMPSA